MRKLTAKQVTDDHGGTLPADAVLTADAEEHTAAGTDPETGSPGSATPSPNRNKRSVKRSERFSALNTFTDVTMATLKPAEVKVWVVLFRDTKADGTARTGQTDIARRAGLSERMVRYALDGLQAKGLLVVVRRGRLDSGPSVYRVNPTANA